MTGETHPIAGLTDAALDATLRRATRVTLILGAVPAIILWIASGWRDAAMLAIGAVLSAVSILEWRRLIRIFNAKLDKQKTPRGASLVVSLFLLRLLLFAAVIYVSLKSLHGSAIALLCGLALAVVAIAWEALRLLRD
jgi:hypothetical protein